MARRLRIKPYGEVRLRHFTARNTRKGGGGEIDFIAYSPKGILWTDDLNKNQITCMHSYPEKLVVLPLPVGFPQFDGLTQIVTLQKTSCFGGKCWQEVLHYDQFYTDVNVGSDTETGGYVMAKSNSSKTCDSFVSDECILKLGGEACMQNVISDFLASLPPDEQSSGSDVPIAAIVVPSVVGGVLLIALGGLAVCWVRRKRQREADAKAAAEAAAEAAKLGGGGRDAEKGLGGGRAGTVSMGLAAESHSNTSSKDTPSSEHTHHHTAASFDYVSGQDMGRHMGLPGGAIPSMGSVGSSSGAQVEGVMDDGSLCTIAVGPALGQGSFGVVFKGVWQSKPVAVKVIMCERNYSDQVANEVKLMMSAACNHPNLLRAYACMSRTRVVNRSHPAAVALEATINTLSTRARSGNQSQQPHNSGSGNTAVNRSAEMAETWIVSEYCDLGSLAPHVHGAKRFLTPPSPAAPGAGRRPRLAAMLGCLRDIAAGMAHLHTMNIVHGDLKLANVLLSSKEASGEVSGPLMPPTPAPGSTGLSGSDSLSAGCAVSLPSCLPSDAPLPADTVAKVADFGLSRWLKEGQTHHSTKTVGTVTHMPPELLRSGKLTLSGDVYSFGIIMWEVFTGSVPYKGLMYGEVVERVVVSHRRPEFPPHAPLAYRSLAERCWASEAAVRPTFASVLSELEAMFSNAATLQDESDLVALPLCAGSGMGSFVGSGGDQTTPEGAALAATLEEHDHDHDQE
ncbi:hypothetical protein HYH03_013068 [Edaphochlamys debaryana]|uniref:Protein kinase domain-containing protein n=1 Tax=Edaphochlamys debaryana TaxID=47281 RepID=A0A836BUW6_9CHLO|nr:hypothetical protein HYH03_013068 [Edaphochlamys debaryana]|eukprot:KAG2488379.1 hypothetical protein HYH03_013068 [Edaphochlamys debaryana]